MEKIITRMCTTLAMRGYEVSCFAEELYLGAYVLKPCGRDDNDRPVEWGVFHQDDDERPLATAAYPLDLEETLIKLADVRVTNSQDD